MRVLAIALVIVGLGLTGAQAAKKGDTVMLQLVNRHADEHGFEIAAFGVKEVVPGEKTANVKFTAHKAGIFPIKCQLHPAHVVGQFVVLE